MLQMPLISRNEIAVVFPFHRCWFLLRALRHAWREILNLSSSYQESHMLEFPFQNIEIKHFFDDRFGFGD